MATSRRGLLIGGAVVALGTIGYLNAPHARPHRPRKAGELDYAGAQWVAAAGANWRTADRPDDYRVDRIVIHVVQGSFDSALRAFQDPGHKAAAHYVVRKDGHVAQTVRELDVAFHAGNREYNERSVGIEHEGFVDEASSFTDTMYTSSARLTAAICARYRIAVDREHIIGHVEVPGTDHTDPGPHWDWPRYIKLVAAAGRV
ncbi:N-acetylmuramoyl-L-alanine amidase [Streptomyces sp. NBC_00083]|uniref:N-acetylmuramoyl-L-alanine amidase n=1 Tax=Streptomyces sp. NBC_00083 TaxID=2975647 RepID=UPI002254F4FA|nr:N-acetylmuramoyl-L-alanine amidase [Streptomyces sp. NBC_00083]MCX5385826.1 N-acetylmuramoyl-L-alanine amidase [Streptomyces sp. NBC_00083]